ncbi:two-component system regulatory protein YycI [Fructilactobacillus vespulae]|uniref:two-component system regulatory protein YycI n=1 Tax=Fructilactobacillus vespulae TaxID=1249630 RepID=UPI0039B3818B
MNFRRIQEIFLLAFIVIDIFLFMMTKNNNIQNDTNTANSSSSIIKEMKRDNISIGKLSEKVGIGYYLSATRDGELENQINTLKNQTAQLEDDDTLASTFKNEIKVDDDHPENKINDLLKKKGFVLNGDSYVYNEALSTKTKVVYDQKAIKGVFDNDESHLIFNVSHDHYLTGYSQQKLTDVKILHEKADLISQERAVIWLYQYNGVPNNSKITRAHLAYSKMLHINGKDVYIPTWIITTKSKTNGKEQVHRINAFNGSEFKMEHVQVVNQDQQAKESVEN